IVPEEGGDTSLANMYAALAEMPADLRRAIEGRSIKQDAVFDTEGRPGIRPGGVAVDDVASSAGISTPIIQVHARSGRPYLYLGNRLNAHGDAMKIAITGASGPFGAGVTRALVQDHAIDPRDLILVSRNPGRLAEWAARGADTRGGDFDDQESLVTALHGADKMLMIS